MGRELSSIRQQSPAAEDGCLPRGGSAATTQVPEPLQCSHLLQRLNGSGPALAATTPVHLQCSHLLQRMDGLHPALAATTPVPLQCSHMLQKTDGSQPALAATTQVRDPLQCRTITWQPLLLYPWTYSNHYSNLWP